MALTGDALGVRLDTRTANDILADALATLRQRLPQWIPRNGAGEVALMETLAQIVEGVVTGADVILGATVEAILAGLYGVPRLPGASATGQMMLVFDSPVTTVIPAGSRFSLRDDGLDVLTLADTAVTAATSCTVTVATAMPSAAANGLGSESVVDVLADIPNLISADLIGVLSGGMDPESDSEYLSRAIARLNRVTSGLVVSDHFTAFVLEDGRAVTATTIPAWDGVDIATAGTDAGHVTVVCVGRGGQVPDADRADLVALMQDLTVVGVTVHVVPAVLVPVPVTVTVHGAAGWAAADVQASVTEVISGWLDPATWEWGEPVRVTTLIALIAGVTSVDYVASLAKPAADVVLQAHQLPVIGAISVTVT